MKEQTCKGLSLAILLSDLSSPLSSFVSSRVVFVDSTQSQS